MALQSLTTAAAIAIALSCADPVPAQTPAEMFTKAKLLEHQDGDAKAAVATYAQVVVHQDAPASLQAKALFRQALCYIKLEQAQLAREAFARIQKRFPGTDEALQARLMRASLVPVEPPVRPRDLTFEVQQLLVAGTESRKAAQSALRSLHFLGASAVPVLKQALTHSDRSVQLIAAHALAARGDGEVLEPLLAEAGKGYFDTRRNPTSLTFGAALRTLCDKRVDLWAHVKRAYDGAQGRAKADLLQFCSSARRFESISNYHTLLESKDASERTAAWGAFRVETYGERGKEYVDRLLEVWSAHPKWRSSMASLLSNASQTARKAGEATYARWLEAACEAARSDQEDVAREMVLTPCPVEIVGAMIASPFAKVRNQAAQLARSITLTDANNRNVAATSVGDYAKLAGLFLDAATKRIERDAAEANMHLYAVMQIAGQLPPTEFRALSSRVLQRDVLARLLRVRRSPSRGQTRQALLGFFGGRRLASAAGYPFVDKYLPELIKLAKLDEWTVLQEQGLKELEDFVKDAWAEVTPAVRSAVRDAVIAVEPSMETTVERARTALIKRLVIATPPVFTVEELLTNLDGRYPGRTRLIDLLQKKEGLQQRYPAKELIAAVNANLKNPRTRVADLSTAARAAGFDRPARDALLRKLWAHPDARARRDVIERLAANQVNLAFLNERYDDTWTHQERVDFVEWLEDVSGALRVPPLLRLVDDVEDEYKVRICVQLSSLADRSAAPKLIELLGYRNLLVRSAAERALESIRAIQAKKDSWREWYEKSGGVTRPGPSGPGREQ